MQLNNDSFTKQICESELRGRDVEQWCSVYDDFKKRTEDLGGMMHRLRLASSLAAFGVSEVPPLDNVWTDVVGKSKDKALRCVEKNISKYVNHLRRRKTYTSFELIRNWTTCTTCGNSMYCLFAFSEEFLSFFRNSLCSCANTDPMDKVRKAIMEKHGKYVDEIFELIKDNIIISDDFAGWPDVAKNPYSKISSDREEVLKKRVDDGYPLPAKIQKLNEQEKGTDPLVTAHVLGYLYGCGKRIKTVEEWMRENDILQKSVNLIETLQESPTDRYGGIYDGMWQSTIPNYGTEGAFPDFSFTTTVDIASALTPIAADSSLAKEPRIVNETLFKLRQNVMIDYCMNRKLAKKDSLIGLCDWRDRSIIDSKVSDIRGAIALTTLYLDNLKRAESQAQVDDLRIWTERTVNWLVDQQEKDLGYWPIVSKEVVEDPANHMIRQSDLGKAITGIPYNLSFVNTVDALICITRYISYKLELLKI